MTNVICPYCNTKAVLCDSSVVYHGRSFGLIYLCSNWPKCDAFVGVHEGTKNPLGQLANAECREWRKKAHRAFDELWRGSKMTRKEAYKKLREIMGMTTAEAHIGNFDVSKCQELVNKLGKEIVTSPTTSV